MTQQPSTLSIEDLFRHFVETSTDLLTVVDTQARFLYVSPSSRHFFGLPPEECVGRSAWDFVHPDDVAETRRVFGSWLATRETDCFTFENRQVDRDGHERTLLWTVTRQPADDGRTPLFTSSARDISSLREFEEALQHSRAHFESILDGMLDPVVTIDPKGLILDANESCRRLFGYAPDELVGSNIKLLLPEPYCSEHDDYLERYHRTGETHILGRTREFPVLHKNGDRITVELSVSRIVVPGEEQPVFCGSFRDASARKVAELALKEREQRFHAIFDQVYELVGLLHPDGTLIEINRTALEIAGTRREDVIGQPFWESPWWSTADRDRLQDAVRRAASGEFVRFEATHERKDGSRINVDFSLKPFRDESGEIVLLLPEGRDITSIKLAQERETAMLRAFADIGESASILAHEIKNPITSVNAALRAVANQLGEDEQEVLEELVERMQKLERLMRRTLSLARPIELRPTELEPGELLAKTARLMQPHLDEVGVRLEPSVAATCPQVPGDADLLEDVLTNLVRNAAEALESGGCIRLRAEPEGSSLLLVVEDDGPGIPETLLPTLFKPFVTTKASGTGIGLALARKVVEAHGGTITARNGASGGARFELRLPSKP